MSSFIRITALFGLSLLLVACKVHFSDTPAAGESTSAFSAPQFQDCLKNRFTSLSASYINEFPNVVYLDTLRNFYNGRQYQSIFFRSFADTTKIPGLVQALAACTKHGLPEEFYNLDKIRSTAARLAGDSLPMQQRYELLADEEILLSNAVIKYAGNLRYGTVNPTKIFPESYTLPVTDSAKIELFAPLQQADLLKYLKDIEPKSARYLALQSQLQRFSGLAKESWPLLRTTDHKLKRGDKSTLIPAIARRLAQLGFLDSASAQPGSITNFNQTLLNAVVAFQRAQGLIDDGTIGKPTIDKLNIKPQEYIDQIKVNLERFRWNDYTVTKNYVYVNVPDFYLHIIENGKEKEKIKVCAGRKRPANFAERMEKYQKTHNWRDRPDDWETPTVASEIYRIVLNPTWSVPRNIIREEIYPEFMKDPNYLKRKNFKVLLNNKEVDVASVDLHKYSPNNVPYSFVQNSGEGNALGKLKFQFKNKFDIYLHDTPTRAPFGNSIRAVSHGCMRVEKPLELAEYLLQGNNRWNMDYVKAEIGASGVSKAKLQEYRENRAKLRKGAAEDKSTLITLEHKMPVYVDYYTAWVDENGTLNMRTDVYGRDSKLKKALFGNEE